MANADLLIIDWQESMEQCGNDLDFLKEIMQDVIEEAETAEDDIKTGIEVKNFNCVMRAAHRTRGNASYLACYALKDIATKVREKSREAMDDPTKSEEVLRLLKPLHMVFKSAVDDLKEEVIRWCNDVEGPNLKAFKYCVASEEMMLTLDSCPICYDDFKLGDDLCSRKDCNHLHHEKCLMNWSRRNSTCPVCRG